MIQNDPRTHFFVLIVQSISIFLYETQWQFYVMIAFSLLYMILHGAWKEAMYAMLAYIAFLLILQFDIYITPALALMFSSMARVLPALLIGIIFLQSSSSRILYMMDRYKLPKPFLIVTMIFLRFFPLIMKEMKTIYHGIKVRGIFPTPLHVLKQPLLAYECIVVPLSFRCLKLSSELAVAAEIRGIQSMNNRTTIHRTAMHPTDISSIVAVLALLIYVVVGGQS